MVSAARYAAMATPTVGFETSIVIVFVYPTDKLSFQTNDMN